MKKKHIVLLFILTWVLIVLGVIIGVLLSEKRVNIFFYRAEKQVQKVMSATAEEYIFLDDTLKGLCTAIAYKREGYLYYFLTAAHCVSGVDIEKEEIVLQSDIIILAVSDDASAKEKDGYFADILGIGYQPAGDDVAILTAYIPKDIAVIELADTDIHEDQCVFFVGFPTEADGNVFFGHVTDTQRRGLLELRFENNDNSIIGKINSFKRKVASSLTNDFTFIESQFYNIRQPAGASGSALMNCISNKIQGIIVFSDHYNPASLTAVPVSRFKEFERQILNNTYPYKVRRPVNMSSLDE